MAFFKKLEEELRYGINAILQHPFLTRLHHGELSRGQLQFFAEQYNVYCQYFPRFLAACAANIPDDATRMPIIENLWEEHGEGKLSKSHRVLYERFGRAAGLTREELEHSEPLPTTSIVVEHLLDVCADDHFLVGLGALGPGTEFFTNEEYSLIAEGLRHYDFLTEKDLEFWTVHISLDEEHYSDIVASILPWTTSVAHRHLVRQGAKKAIDLELLFWDGLEDHLPKR